MNLNPSSRVKLSLKNLVTNYEPADTTVEVGIDDTFYPAIWIGDAVKSGTAEKWTRQAETEDWFCGPEVEDEEAVTLELGAHKVEARLTTGGQIVVFKAADLTVAE